MFWPQLCVKIGMILHAFSLVLGQLLSYSEILFFFSFGGAGSDPQSAQGSPGSVCGIILAGLSDLWG